MRPPGLVRDDSSLAVVRALRVNRRGAPDSRSRQGDRPPAILGAGLLPARPLQAEGENPLEELGVAPAIVLRRGGELLGLADVRVRVGVEEVQPSRSVEAVVDARVAG